jgi:hypothetical protein
MADGEVFTAATGQGLVRAVQFCSSNAWDRAKRVLTGVEAAYKESTIWREYVNL